MAVKQAKEKVEIPPAYYVGAVVVVLGLFAWAFTEYQARKYPPKPGVLTPEAKQYVRNLSLSDVEMKAAESYMKQAVVEVTGKIGNKGDRTLKLVEINCVFRDAFGQVVLARARGDRWRAHGHALAGRHQEFPPGFRQYSRELEPGAAGTGDCANCL